MQKSGMLAAAGVVVGTVMISSGAHAQTKPLEVWTPPAQGEVEAGTRLPRQESAVAPQAGGQPQAGTPAGAQAHAGTHAQAAAQPQVAPAPAPAPAYEEDRGGFFLGAHAGKGWVYDDVDQAAVMGSAGYRWQAGPVTLIGIEVAAGQLDDERISYGSVPSVDFASVGVNARFNFGRGNPVFGLVRSGYMSAEDDFTRGTADGGYLGLGVGVDFNRHVNMSLVYTHYLYFDDYDWDTIDIDDINSADTLMLGVEVRF